MTNERHPKAVDVTFGGATYTLHYNLAALARLRDAGVDAFALDGAQLTDPRVIVKLVWAGVQKYHPGTTTDAIAEAIELDELGDVAQAFTEALRKASTKEIGGPDPR